MANTHVVLEGVKDYTLELLGTKARDEAVDAADRAEAQAERAEAAADEAEVGVRDDTVAKQHLTPGLRDELDGKADRTEVGAKADEGHKHTSADITDASHRIGSEYTSGTVVTAHPENGDIYRYGTTEPDNSSVLVNKFYVDREVGKKADTGHTHTAADVGARPDTWTPTAAEVGAATPGYVDSRIQLVTAWPASPVAGVLYLMEEE